MYCYTRWHWKAKDCSSCIVLYPLQVGCHIICSTKQQWVTVVNSWQNKSRYKCGSCSTCQESTNRCQSTQFKVACTSNIYINATKYIQPACSSDWRYIRYVLYWKMCFQIALAVLFGNMYTYICTYMYICIYKAVNKIANGNFKNTLFQ